MVHRVFHSDQQAIQRPPHSRSRTLLLYFKSLTVNSKLNSSSPRNRNRSQLRKLRPVDLKRSLLNFLPTINKHSQYKYHNHPSQRLPSTSKLPWRHFLWAVKLARYMDNLHRFSPICNLSYLSSANKVQPNCKTIVVMETPTRPIMIASAH